jgi:hypothetical protein
LSAWRIPNTTKQHPDGREDGAERVERGVRVGRQRILDAAAQHHDQRHYEHLEHECRAPADRRGDHAADQRSGGGADAAHPADAAEGARASREVVEVEGREYVDRRDQQRRPDAFEDRVADDQDAEAGGDRADQRPEPVDR